MVASRDVHEAFRAHRSRRAAAEPGAAGVVASRECDGRPGGATGSPRVGRSLWSNVGRLSYELSAADKGCLPPLISRDVGWCSVDGQLQDGTVYGHLNC